MFEVLGGAEGGAESGDALRRGEGIRRRRNARETKTVEPISSRARSVAVV